MLLVRLLRARLAGSAARAPARQAALLVLLLLFPAALAGCLFPPIAPAGEAGENVAPPPPGPDVPIFDQDSFQAVETGRVAAGASVPTGMEQGEEPHIFMLPARVISIRLELEWSSTVYDLDLVAEQRRDRADGIEVVWADANRDGDVGSPDSPALLVTTDRARIMFDEPSTLRVTVHAKAGVDVPYTISVRALYLVPSG